MARRAARVLAVGDGIVDRITPPMRPLPRGDFQGHIEAFETLPGGNATNFALHLPRGRSFRRADPRHPTGAPVALSWTSGGRALITSLAANGEFRLRDI